MAGRHPIELDRDQILRMAACMCTVEEIAYVMGCSKDTIERNYMDALEEGRAKGRASLRRKQYEVAMTGDKSMLIWLGKQLLGQSEKLDSNVTFTEQIFDVVPPSDELGNEG